MTRRGTEHCTACGARLPRALPVPVARCEPCARDARMRAASEALAHFLAMWFLAERRLYR